MTKTIILVYILLNLLALLSSAPAEDLVDLSKLPNKFKVDYKSQIYSGYLQSTPGNKLHYVFTPSQRDSKSDPLVLWLNGGPGCSSLLGFLSENGPFYFKDWTLDITNNKYSWNKLANVLYIESPAGVGFSTGTKKHSDNEVVQENLAALISFFIKYPEYKSRDFFISGESYAGIYIPTLTSSIIDFNKNIPLSSQIKLKGILVGNGLTDQKYDMDSAVLEFAYGHSLYPIEMKNDIDISCGNIPPYKVNDPECQVFIEKVNDLLDNLYPYDIYKACSPPEDVFVSEVTKERNRKLFRLRNPRNYIKNKRNTQKDFLQSNLNDGSDCNDAPGVEEFFNDPTVQQAFHVQSIKFEVCNDEINSNYQWTENFNYSPLYLKIIKNNIRVIKYSGDTDAVVPFTGTRQWIKSLNLDVIKEYSPWYADGSKEVAGFYTKYNGLIFATVKGTGHMVPQWKRKEAFTFFSRFLNNEDL